MTTTTEDTLPVPRYLLDGLASAVTTEAAEHFTCSEAEAVAAVLRLLDEDGAAAALMLTFHAYADDEGDDHYGMQNACDECGADAGHDHNPGCTAEAARRNAAEDAAAVFAGTLADPASRFALVEQEDRHAHLPRCGYCHERIYVVDGTLVRAADHEDRCPSAPDGAHDREPCGWCGQEITAAPCPAAPRRCTCGCGQEITAAPHDPAPHGRCACGAPLVDADGRGPDYCSALDDGRQHDAHGSADPAAPWTCPDCRWTVAADTEPTGPEHRRARCQRTPGAEQLPCPTTTGRNVYTTEGRRVECPTCGRTWTERELTESGHGVGSLPPH